jgi:hypothetical protein
MTPREALAEYGRVYQLGHCATGSDLSVHLRPDCPAVTVEREADRIDHPRRLPLRCSLCAACDPDHEVRMSPEYDGVPAIEDHDDRPAWAPAEVRDD